MVELVKATSCPKCGSTDIRRRPVYSRNIRVLYSVEIFLVTQYCCRQCQNTFNSIKGVKKGCQVAEEVKRKALDIYMGGPDAEEVMKRLREDLKVQIFRLNNLEIPV